MTLEKTRTATNGSHPASPAPLGPIGFTPSDVAARRPRITVVIPARNEAESLPHVLEKIPSWVHEVILVDGLSIDDTVGVAKRNFPEIRIVHQSGKGKGNALREGFYNATGDVVIAMDADGSMDPGEIDRFVELIDIGFDYVKGSRIMDGGGSEDLTRVRRFGNWVFRTLTNVLNGSRFSDLCYGYFAFRRNALERLDLRADGFEIETEINIRAHRAGLRIGEVPSTEFVRTHGTSNLRAFSDGLRILATIFHASLGRQQRSAREESTKHVNGHHPAAAAQLPVPLNSERNGNGNGHGNGHSSNGNGKH
jgi:glycosyltransferase involved in cell wall biosynthesis